MLKSWRINNRVKETNAILPLSMGIEINSVVFNRMSQPLGSRLLQKLWMDACRKLLRIYLCSPSNNGKPASKTWVTGKLFFRSVIESLKVAYIARQRPDLVSYALQEMAASKTTRHEVFPLNFQWSISVFDQFFLAVVYSHILRFFLKLSLKASFFASIHRNFSRTVVCSFESPNQLSGSHSHLYWRY